MKRIVVMVCAVIGLALSSGHSQASWGSLCYSGYQPWWNIFAKRYKCLTPEEERLQKFWHDYYDAMQNFYCSLDHIDWVAYYKNHGYAINGGPGGGCGRINYAPVFVSPGIQWAVPAGGAGGPPCGPPYGDGRHGRRPDGRPVPHGRLRRLRLADDADGPDGSLRHADGPMMGQGGPMMGRPMTARWARLGRADRPRPDPAGPALRHGRPVIARRGSPGRTIHASITAANRPSRPLVPPPPVQGRPLVGRPCRFSRRTSGPGRTASHPAGEFSAGTASIPGTLAFRRVDSTRMPHPRKSSRKESPCARPSPCRSSSSPCTSRRPAPRPRCTSPRRVPRT